MHDLRHLAQQRGYEVVAEITDNDTSAYAQRAGFDQLWKLVRSGAVDHVVVWQTSRLVRSRKDRAQVISEFGQHGVDIVAFQGPSLELSNAYGRVVADLMTAFDSMESEVKAERVSAAIADGARKGRPWGLVPYGWNRQDAVQVIDEEQAAIVRELVDRLLAGISIREIVADLNARGESPPKGKAWSSSTVRQLVRRPANVGLRVHKGTELPGNWPAIVERSKHDRVVALLSAPERRSHTGPRPGSRKHLLTHGIGRCGVCDGMLRVARRVGRKTEPLIYMCASARGCTGRVQSRVDDLVAAVVIGRLQMPDALDWMLGDDEEARNLSERVETLQRRLDEAADSQADGKIDIRQLERITARLMPELEAARRHRDAAARSLDFAQLQELARPQAAARWASMPVSAKRSVLEALCIEVVLLPRAKRGPGFEPETVEILWGTNR
jgi:DNA invertase Pin-like site-specific DNA recombinase